MKAKKLPLKAIGLRKALDLMRRPIPRSRSDMADRIMRRDSILLIRKLRERAAKAKAAHKASAAVERQLVQEVARQLRREIKQDRVRGSP